jgi:hypothetical protein
VKIYEREKKQKKRGNKYSTAAVTNNESKGIGLLQG